MEISSSKQYEVLGSIGSGGFGDVYRIKGRKDGQFYALKTVNLEKLKSQSEENDEISQLKQMALREAEIMKQVQLNEHIVNVFSSFTEGSFFHIVMELFEKGTLKDAIRSRKGEFFSEIEIARWAAQLAVTLKHLHNNKILHRDVKTENIFLTENNNLKLGDFGISKMLDRSSSLHLAVGTVTHMAPELLTDDEDPIYNPIYNDKAEVWAFGVVMYEMAQLQLPFLPSSNIGTVIKAVCKKPIPPITANISPELRSFIETKLLSRDPTVRPSMDQVIGHPCILTAIVSLGALTAVNRATTTTKCLRPGYLYNSRN